MIKKQKKTIIISLVIIALLAIGYFVFLSPAFNKEKTVDLPELIEGEQYNEAKDKILVFPMVEKEDITDIKIHNSKGDFGFYRDSDGEFYLTGYKGTPYDETNFTSLVASIRNPLALTRVTTDMSKLPEYGLDEGSNPAHYTFTTKSGESYKMYIGNLITTSGGYYAKLDGRDAVYVLDTTSKYVLMEAREYVTPILSMPTDTTDYYQTKYFTLRVDGNDYISVEYMTEQERIATASTSYYKMLVPANYVPSSSNYDELLKTFNEFKGTQTLAFGNSNDAMTAKDLAEYGLDNPKYEIYYRYAGVDNYVYVSEQNEDGTYNAYSIMFNIVAKVSEQTLKFLKWDFIDFIDKPLFQKNINDISSITIKGEGVEETYKITGETSTLTVTPSNNKAFNEAELTSFKRIYVKLLSLAFEDYTDSTSKEEPLMQFTVKTDNGNVYEYNFYNYSTRRCYFTINGEGEFYVLRDRVEKILSDVAKLQQGGTVTSEES